LLPASLIAVAIAYVATVPFAVAIAFVAVCWQTYKIPTEIPTSEPNMYLSNHNWRKTQSDMGEKQA
jgi:hypothetical protein